MEKIKVAVIGCGFWGMKILGEYHRLLEEGRIGALFACDSDDAKLDEVAERYSDVKVTKDYKETTEFGITCAHILAPNCLHYPITKYLLEKGVHCLTEKPLTEEYTKSEELVRMASEKSLILKTGYIWRYTNMLPVLKKTLQDGYFSKVDFVRFTWHSYTDHMVGTSILWDQLPHLINTYSYLFNEAYQNCRIEAVHTEGYRQPHSEFAYVVLNYETNGVKVIFDTSWLFPTKERVIEIFGERAGKKCFLFADMLKQSIHHNEGEKLIKDYENPNNTLYEEVSNFVSAVSGEADATNGDVKDSLPQLRLIERIVEVAGQEDLKQQSQP